MNDELYVSCRVVKTMLINTGQLLEMTWVDGMVGVLPVFTTKEQAEAYSGAEVIEIAPKTKQEDGVCGK